MQHPSPGVIHRSELCGLHLSHACMHMARGPLPRLPQVFPWELHRIYLSWQSFQGKLGAWWCLNGTALQKSDELPSCSFSKGGIPKELMGHMGRSPRTGPFPANRLGFQWSTASGLCQVDGHLWTCVYQPLWEPPLLETSTWEKKKVLVTPTVEFSIFAVCTSHSQQFPLCPFPMSCVPEKQE